MELAELLERVKAAWGPDRELDALLFCVASPEFKPCRNSVCRGDWAVRASDGFGGSFSRAVVPVTASLDAALALVERVLPRWEFSLSVEYPGEVAKPVWRVEIGDPLVDLRGTALSPALALITAALEALIYLGGQAAVGSALPEGEA